MVNILPTEIKLELKKNYLWRRRVALVFAFLVAGFIALVLGVTLYLIVEINQGGLKSLLTKDGAAKDIKTYEELAQELKKTDEMVKKISFSSNAYQASALLVKVAELKNKGIKIDDFQYIETEKGISLLLKGKSLSRKDLTDFLGSLRSSSLFISIDSPLSNLINEGEARYSINLLLASSTPLR